MVVLTKCFKYKASTLLGFRVQSKVSQRMCNKVGMLRVVGEKDQELLGGREEACNFCAGFIFGMRVLS